MLIESRYYEPPDVLLKLVWPDKELDTRSIYWKKIRSVLSLMGKAPAGNPGSGTPPTNLAKSEKAEPVTSLSSSQEEFILASYKEASNPTELTRLLFENPKLMPGSAETKLVSAYIRKIDPSYRREDEPAEGGEYLPPKNIPALAGRLNRFGIGTRPDGKLLGDGGYSAQETKQLEALLRYMRRPAFKVEADGFTRRIDREVFEEVFMSACWDKPDLTPEYVLQYLSLASVTVRGNQAQRTVDKLTERFNAALEDPTQRLSKTEVDALKNTADKTGEYLKQMNALIKTLQGDRAKVMNERIAGSSSMHPLVQAWRTKEGRAKTLEIAKKYQKDLKGEVVRLSEFDAFRAEIFGLSQEEILK